MSTEIRKPTPKERGKTTYIEYELDVFDVVKVTIPKRQAEEAIVEVARKECKGNVDGWGRIIKHHETHDGAGIESYEWWEVEFRRRSHPKEE
jgi:hypothetical protein